MSRFKPEFLQKAMYFNLLELQVDATDEDIEKGWKRKVKESKAARDEEMYKNVVLAKTVLTNPTERN